MMLFMKILFTEFIAEMGDKTQLMLVALTSKYKIRDIIIGTAVAILVLNGLAVLAGGLVSEFIPTWLVKLVAAAAFMYFAITSLGIDDEEEDADEKGRFSFAPLTVFCTFFVAELGDKTQLTAITFGANEGMDKAIVVWIACSIGLFAADIIGMMVGYFLGNKMPEGFLGILAFVIFSIFGVFTVYQGLVLAGEAGVIAIPAVPVTAVAAVIFAVACVFYRKSQVKKIN